MMKKFNFLSISSSGSRKRPFSYRSRIKPVLFPYRSRIVLLSFSYRSPIILASRSGNNTETIRKQHKVDICWKGGRYVMDTWWKLCLPFPTNLYFSSMRKSETGEIVT